MELIPTSGGRIPNGRMPIVGGHERDHNVKLYHAVASVYARGGIVRVPGKTAPHLWVLILSFASRDLTYVSF